MINLANATLKVGVSTAKLLFPRSKTFVDHLLSQRNNHRITLSCFCSICHKTAPFANAERNHLKPNHTSVSSITIDWKKYSTSDVNEDVDQGRVSSFYDRYVFPEPPELVSEEEHDIVIEEVNKCLADTERGRLFAVVLVGGIQYKVTDNDLIRTTGDMRGIALGEKVRLEKVLVVGGRDFTLVGRPIVRRSLVKVEATVIEKTPGAEKVVQRFIPRESFQRRYIYTPIHTVLRVNSVEAYADLL